MPTFINEVELSLSTTGSYEPIYIGSYVPANAAVALVKIYNPSDYYSYTILCRSGDSSQTFTTEGGHGGCFRDYTGATQAVKIGSGGYIGVLRTVSIGRCVLYGYLTSDEITAIDTMTSVSIGVAATWTLTDLSSYFSTYGVKGKVYGVLMQSMTIPDYVHGLQARPTGATTTFLGVTTSQAYNGVIACQLDNNGKLELYSSSASATQKFYIVGFIMKDIIVNTMTDATVVTPGSSASWTNTGGFPTNATAAILSAKTTGGIAHAYGAIPKTAPTSVLQTMGLAYGGYNMGVTPLGADQQVQLYKADTTISFWSLGYWKLPSENQLFFGVNT